jgi:hypothetical protein
MGLRTGRGDVHVHVCASRGRKAKGKGIVVRGARLRCRPHSAAGRIAQVTKARILTCSRAGVCFCRAARPLPASHGYGFSHVGMNPLSRMRSNAPLNTLPQRKMCTSNTQSTCRKKMKVPTTLHLPVSPQAAKGARTGRLSGTMVIKPSISREWPSGMQCKVSSTFCTRTNFLRVFLETLGRL